MIPQRHKGHKETGAVFFLCVLCAFVVFLAVERFLLGNGRLDQSHNRLEALGIGDGHVGEDLAIEFDVGLEQSGDEFAVAEAQRADGGVDARDPEPAEISLSVAAIAVGVDAGADEVFFGGSGEASTAADVSLRLLEQTIFGPGTGSALGGSHCKTFVFRRKPGLSHDWETFFARSAGNGAEAQAHEAAFGACRGFNSRGCDNF
jgi:hypothetical protein